MTPTSCLASMNSCAVDVGSNDVEPGSLEGATEILRNDLIQLQPGGECAFNRAEQKGLPEPVAIPQSHLHRPSPSMQTAEADSRELSPHMLVRQHRPDEVSPVQMPGNDVSAQLSTQMQSQGTGSTSA